MGKNIIIIHQDRGNRLTDNYSKFEYRFKNLDQVYTPSNYYYIISLGNKNCNFKKEKNIDITIIKSSPLRQFLDFIKLRSKIIKLTKKHSISYIYSPYIYLLSIIPKYKNIKIVGFLRDQTGAIVKSGGIMKRIIGNIFYLLDFIAFKKIDTLFYNGKSLLKYANTLGYKGESIFNPRPISDRKYIHKSLINIKNKHHINKGKVIILTVARLSKEKNISMGIQALRYLPNYSIYMIIGEGIEKTKLQKLARKLGLENRVIFIGFIVHKDIRAYYKTSDIFWLLSKTEGTPNVLQESMYMGLPAIVSKIKPMQNIIDSKSGIILKSWDPKELADKTIALINNKNMYNKLIINMRNKITKRIKQNKKVSDFFI